MVTEIAGPIVEVTLAVPAGHGDELDAWLDARLRQAQPPPGVGDVRIWKSPVDDERAVRICLFRCRDDSEVDDLLDTWFADLEADAADALGDSLELTSRCLRPEAGRDILRADAPDCLNCGTRLSGQYCGQCGQRARSRLISLWGLVAEAFGDLFELDSRLWRTIIPLLVRPGQLTRDYLVGRRARYMPPFRSYLVLSLIFFVVAFFDPRADLGLLFEELPAPTAEEVAEQEARAEQAKKDILDELAKGGIVLEEAVPADAEGAADDANTGKTDGTEGGLRVTLGDDEVDSAEDCRVTDESVKDLPRWLQRRLTPQRLQQLCQRIAADKGAAFLDLLLDNIPVALIVLLPLMALVLKILYPLSRRYFVEHLLFFVHFHGFFFAMLTLEILFGRLAALVSLPEFLTVIAIVAASFYIPAYLYVAMRRVYNQGHLVTFLKYIALVAAYMLGMSLTMFGAAFFALVSV